MPKPKLTSEDYGYLYRGLQEERATLQRKIDSINERLTYVRTMLSPAQIQSLTPQFSHSQQHPIVPQRQVEVPKKRRMSAATRKKMSEAARSRWRQRQEAAEMPIPEPDPMKPRLRGSRKPQQEPDTLPEPTTT